MPFDATSNLPRLRLGGPHAGQRPRCMDYPGVMSYEKEYRVIDQTLEEATRPTSPRGSAARTRCLASIDDRDLDLCEHREVRRHQLLRCDHVAQLTGFVEGIRRERGLGSEVPYFDPLDGGANARALFVLEAPGPKAVASGLVPWYIGDGTKCVFRSILISDSGPT